MPPPRGSHRARLTDGGHRQAASPPTGARPCCPRGICQILPVQRAEAELGLRVGRILQSPNLCEGLGTMPARGPGAQRGVADGGGVGRRVPPDCPTR